MESTTKYSPAAKLVTSIVTFDGGRQLRNTTTDRRQAINWLARTTKSSMASATSTVLSALRSPGHWVAG